MKLKMILIGLIAFGFAGFAMSATAGSIPDTDSDLIPDYFDNCYMVPNGPDEGINGSGNQVDADEDGYGNQCDGDLTNDGVVGGTDFSVFVMLFGQAGTPADFTGDGVVGGTDFSAFVTLFSTNPGPSGLACAGTIPCQ